jgi:hypothetical protein
MWFWGTAINCDDMPNCVCFQKNLAMTDGARDLGGIMKLLLEVMMAGTVATILILIIVLLIKIHRNERNNPPE